MNYTLCNDSLNIIYVLLYLECKKIQFLNINLNNQEKKKMVLFFFPLVDSLTVAPTTLVRMP